MMAEIAKIRVKLWIKIWVKFAPISLFAYAHGWFDCKNSLTRELQKNVVQNIKLFSNRMVQTIQPNCVGI